MQQEPKELFGDCYMETLKSFSYPNPLELTWSLEPDMAKKAIGVYRYTSRGNFLREDWEFPAGLLL